ncbi:hypothetical protein QTP88_002613 [Uroleucon formosanum]
MNKEKIIALPDHLVEYFLPVDYEVDHIVHEEEVEELEGRIYVNNFGFKYFKLQIRGHRLYKKRNQYCPFTASVNTNLNDNRIHLGYYHDHQETIGDRGIDPAITSFIRTLYNNEIAQEQVKKMRRQRYPRQPIDIGFFQQALVVNGRNVGVIFANIDSIPVVYVLLGSMTEDVYVALFDIIIKKTLMSAIQQSFPEGSLIIPKKMNSVLDLICTNPVTAHVLIMIRDGASRRERENNKTILAGHVQQLNRDEDLTGYSRRVGHHNDG